MKNSTVIINTKELSEKIYDILKYEGEKVVFIAELLTDNCNKEEICKYINIKENELPETDKRIVLYTFVCKTLMKNKKYNEYISNILEYLKYAEGPVELVNIESLLKGYDVYKLKEENKIVEYVEENIYKLFLYIKSEDLFDIIDCLNTFRDNSEDEQPFEIIEDYVAEQLTVQQLKSILRYRCEINPYLFKELEKIIGYDYKTYENSGKNTKIIKINPPLPPSTITEIFIDPSCIDTNPIMRNDIDMYKDILKNIYEEYNKNNKDKDDDDKNKSE